jgi:ribulose-5-phosphate 4-epimerase/fuculose-1-phosphate aldolase
MSADWKTDFSAGLRIMEGHGLTEGFGHLSTRLEDGTVVITPARGPGMAAQEALHVRFSPDGEKLDDELPAPLETPMHLAIYQSRPDVMSICRTHSIHAVSYGVLGKSLQMSHGFSLMMGASVPFHAEGDLISNLEMGQGVAQTLGSGSALLLKGNGALTVGDSIGQAVVRSIYLEEAARIAIQIGCDQKPIEWTESEITDRSRWHAAEAARAWDYYRWKYPVV